MIRRWCIKLRIDISFDPTEGTLLLMVKYWIVRTIMVGPGGVL